MTKNQNASCPCEGGSLPRLIQPVILHILSKEQLTGYQVMQQMENYSMFRKEKANQTGVYRYIRFLKENGYVVAHELPGNIHGESLELTNLGLHCLDEWRQTLSSFRDEIERLTHEIK